MKTLIALTVTLLAASQASAQTQTVECNLGFGGVTKEYVVDVPEDGQVLSVDDDGAETDFATITDAVDVASDGDLVAVCPGEYVEDVRVQSSIDIVGLETDESFPQRVVVEPPSFLEVPKIFEVDAGVRARISGLTLDGTGAHYAMVVDGNVTLDTMVFENLNGTQAVIESSGWVSIADSVFRNNDATAIRMLSAQRLILDNVAFGNNAAGREDGGAVLLRQTPFAIRNCAFEANSAESGGAIAIFGRAGTIENSSFTGNDAEDRGGALSLQNTDVALSRVTFDENAAAVGGAILASHSHLEASELLFATNSADEGAALQVRECDLVLADAYFSENAGSNGIVRLLNGTTASIERSAFGNNESWNGAIVDNRNSDLYVLNTTFATNTTGNFKAALSNSGGEVDLFAVTIHDTQPASGPIFRAYSLWNASGGTIVIGNSILSATGNNWNCEGTITSIGANLEATPSSHSDCGFEVVTSDPMFETDVLEDNGGYTPTLALSESSPAVDAGSCEVAGVTVTHEDQRGLERGVGSGCDIGAYELQNL